MSGHPLRDQAAIVGVGYTEFSKNSGVCTLTLALRAIAAAVADAGLELGDVDGVASHRVGDSVQAVVVAQALGIRDCRYHLDLFGGGSASHSVVAQAAMAVATGVADYVVCWRAINARSRVPHGRAPVVPPPDIVEFQYQVPVRLRDAAAAVRGHGSGLHGPLRRAAGGPRPGRHHPAANAAAQPAGDDAHAAHHGRLPRRRAGSSSRSGCSTAASRPTPRSPWS